MKTETLHIDFAPGARRVSHAGRLLLLAGIVLLAAGLTQSARLVATRERAQATFDSGDARRAGGRAVAAKPDAREVALVRATRKVTSDLATPWARLLGSLGSIPGSNVALLSVEPTVARRSVRLTAEARDASDMLAYVAALQRDSRLSSVVLVSHQLQAQAPGTPIRFQVQAQWGESP